MPRRYAIATRHFGLLEKNSNKDGDTEEGHLAYPAMLFKGLFAGITLPGK